MDVTKTEFNGNTAINNGGIFDILGENVLEEANIKIDNSSFLENKANLGGIISLLLLFYYQMTNYFQRI